jgi:hypothetical protein
MARIIMDSTEKQTNSSHPLADAETKAEVNIETSYQPQSIPQQQQQQQPNPTIANYHVGGSVLAGLPAAQLQAQQQMMLMAQMFQLSQQPVVGNHQITNSVQQAQQNLVQLMNLQQQQQQQGLLFQSMSQAAASNPMAFNMLGMGPLLLSHLGGNTAGFFPNLSQIPNAATSASSAAATPPGAGNNVGPTIQADTDVSDPGWEDQYKALKRYALVNGHTKVPARYKENPKVS